MFTTYIGTRDGVFRLANGDAERIGLEGERVWAIHAWRRDDGHDVILAGTYGNGLFRSADGGKSWQAANEGLTASAFRVICSDPLIDGAILAGTEPARLYRSHDGGLSWSELTGITEVMGYQEWYLPYSPRAGAIRNVCAPGDGQRYLASVEVGGLLDSRDGGGNWTIGEVVIDDDIHFISAHPEDPNLLYASLGYAALKDNKHSGGERHFGGIGRSRDGGSSWEKLENDYTRATIVPPSRTDLVLAGPAPKVGEEGRIVVSTDGGDSWEPASDGITTPMEDMVELFVPAPDDTIWAVCSGGRLLRAMPGEWHWENAVPVDAGHDVQSVTFVPA